MKNNKVCIIICYFGNLPNWFNYWLKSAELSGLDFLFVTDASLESYKIPHNIKIITKNLTGLFNEFKIHTKYNKKIETLSPYKLCDFKPLYGDVFSKEISGYSHWGFGDIDLIFGKVIKDASDRMLDYDLVSFMQDRVSGHLCIVKNTPLLKSAWKKVPNFSNLAFSPDHKGLDEHQWSGLFLPRSFRQRILHFMRRLAGFNPKVYAVNHGVTPHSNQFWLTGDYRYPSKFEWDNGTLVSEDGYELPYLHFMNWKSGRWRPRRYGQSLFPGFSNFDSGSSNKLTITPSGITAKK